MKPLYLYLPYAKFLASTFQILLSAVKIYNVKQFRLVCWLVKQGLTFLH